MSVRKIYEIALRVVGVLFLAQGCRYFVTLVAVTGYSFTQSGQDSVYSILWNLSILLSTLAVGALLLVLGKRFAARLSPQDEQASIYVAISSDDILHIGFVLIGVTLIAGGLSGSIGDVLRVATYYGATSPMQVQFGRSLLGTNFVADVVQIVLGAALLWHQKLYRHLKTLGVFLQDARDKQDEDSNPPAA